MAYEDWMPEWQDIWEQLPVSELSGTDRELAEFFFEEGFMTYEDEKIHVDDIGFAREQLWEMLGEEWSEAFDWDAWREAMYG